MGTAQNQADFMASTGVVTHSGPGGSTVTQRLLAAGYPLGGDLSVGGFRSENIIQLIQSSSAQDAVDAWMGDAPHQYTMLSPDLTEIGAGVAVVNGRVYYVIDCARPTASGELPVSTQTVGAGATVPAQAAIIYPVELSTPNADGDVIHEVRSGQTLWQIAISYGVKINDIKQLNNLAGNDIFPGNKLLIKKAALPTISMPTATVGSLNMVTVSLSATATQTPIVTATPAPTLLPVLTPPNKANIMMVALTIVVLAAVGGGVVTWLAGSKRS
jgi:LysM repeat protein